MDRDEDLAAFLPSPPRPAPARREAAIARAMERFDGRDSPDSSKAPASRAARPSQSWLLNRRPYAAAMLAVVIALPLAWTALPDALPDAVRNAEQADPAGEVETVRDPAPAAADSFGPPPTPPKSSDPATAGPPAPASEGDVAAPTKMEEAPTAASRDVASGGEDDLPAGRLEEPSPSASSNEGADVVVTGSRIARPNLTSSSPVTVIGGDNIVVTSRAARRGDWNACTVEDPKRDLAACKRLLNATAKGKAGLASTRIADGLAQAWAGKLDQAIASFDEAIAAAPHSSGAYLNRGLAWRRQGDLDRALADLDRAVRHSPDSARAYYNRSLVLSERGDARRARRDADRAVELDSRYASIIRTTR